jgi:hypothetical protein
MSKNVELPIRDAILVYSAIEQIQQFFHNPDNYSEIDNFSDQIYPLIKHVYYEIFDNLFPEEIEELISEGKRNSIGINYIDIDEYIE